MRRAKTVALGYIRREVGLPGREVMIGTVKATVVRCRWTAYAVGQADNSLLTARLKTSSRFSAQRLKESPMAEKKQENQVSP